MHCEKIIIDKLSQGNEDALHLLFNLYYTRVVSYSYTYVVDYHTAEDIVQDFLVSFCNKKQLKNRANMES